MRRRLTVQTVTAGDWGVEPPELVFGAPETLSSQIAAWLRLCIKAGTWEPERDLMPSEKQLMDMFGVSRPTVRRAVEILRDEGLVITYPQRGSYVRRHHRQRSGGGSGDLRRRAGLVLPASGPSFGASGATLYMTARHMGDDHPLLLIAAIIIVLAACCASYATRGYRLNLLRRSAGLPEQLKEAPMPLSCG